MKPLGQGFSQHTWQEWWESVGAHREQEHPGTWAGKSCRQTLELAVLSYNLCSATDLQGELSEPQFPHLLNGNNQPT